MRILQLLLLTGVAVAQAPSNAPKPDGNIKQPDRNLKELMRGVALPNSNIIFAVQSKPPKTNTEWQTVVNATVAIQGMYSMITAPGRMRSNGQPVPVKAADFARFASALGPAGKECQKAALAKDIEAIGNCTDTLSEACDNCHKVYRDMPKVRNGQ